LKALDLLDEERDRSIHRRLLMPLRNNLLEQLAVLQRLWKHEIVSNTCLMLVEFLAFEVIASLKVEAKLPLAVINEVSVILELALKDRDLSAPLQAAILGPQLRDLLV